MVAVRDAILLATIIPLTDCWCSHVSWSARGRRAAAGGKHLVATLRLPTLFYNPFLMYFASRPITVTCSSFAQIQHHLPSIVGVTWVVTGVNRVLA